jgi:phage terminase large subunit GpA-like protein
MERTVAYRVVCPSCGEWAQLRVQYVDDHDPTAIAFSCRNQTERTHLEPPSAELQALIPPFPFR